MVQPPRRPPGTSVVDFLEGEGVDYEVIEHEPTMSAAGEARIMHYPPDQVAKTIVLHDGGVYVIAAIPACERLDMHKLREVLGATRRLQLAGEDEIAHEFPSFEVGAVPPFGPTVPAVEVIDPSCSSSRGSSSRRAITGTRCWLIPGMSCGSPAPTPLTSARTSSSTPTRMRQARARPAAGKPH